MVKEPSDIKAHQQMLDILNINEEKRKSTEEIIDILK